MKKQNFIPVKTEATTTDVPTDGIVFAGGAVKATGIVNGKGTLSGYGVVFSTPGANAQKDLSGQYFTKNTYFGPRDGDSCDGAFHHTLPIKGMPEQCCDHLFAPAKMTKDDVGIFTEIVCDMADDYERAVYNMGVKGKLGFSSGTAAHMIRLGDDGEIKRWPIVEISLTPTPCEPRARATAMKALEAETGSEAMKAFVEEFKAIFDSQETAENAFLHEQMRADVAESEAFMLDGQVDDLLYENQRLAELAAIQRDAILLQAQILRLSCARC